MARHTRCSSCVQHDHHHLHQYGYKMDFTVRTAYEYAMFYFGTGAEELEALEEQGGE